MNGSHELIFLIFSSGCRTYISRSTLWITRCGCRGAGSENDTVTYCCKSTLNLLNHHYISTSLYTWFCIGWLILTKEKNIDVSKNETHWLLCNVLVKKLIIYIQITVYIFQEVRYSKHSFFSFASFLLRYKMLIYISLVLTCNILEISYVVTYFLGWCCCIWRSSLSKCRVKG